MTEEKKENLDRIRKWQMWIKSSQDFKDVHKKAYFEHRKNNKCQKCNKKETPNLIHVIALNVNIERIDAYSGFADGLVCLCNDCYWDMVSFLNIPTAETIDTSN